MGCEQSSSRPQVLNNHATINGASGIHPLKPESGSHISKLGLTELNLEDPELQEAATRIQATYRGHRTRKTLKMAQPEEEVVDIDLEDPDVALAATRIQASFRGHQAKRAAEKAEKAGAELSKKLEELNTNAEEAAEELPDLSDPELNKAATKIQAQFRGHMVRKGDEKDPKESK